MLILSQLSRLLIFLSFIIFNTEIYGYNILPIPIPIPIISNRDRYIPNYISRRTPKTRVYIHLEKFNERYNLVHIGVSFSNLYNNVRYDFRAIDQNIYSQEGEKNLIIEYWNRLVYDNIDLESRTIFWGISNKSITEIMLYEKTLPKRYILGLYDCRHYVNRITAWSVDKPTPVWRLHQLWNRVKDDKQLKDKQLKHKQLKHKQLKHKQLKDKQLKHKQLKDNYKKRRIWRWF